LSEKGNHLLYDFLQGRISKNKLLHELFEEQVENTPDHLAVIFKDKNLTYRELNELSNQLARTLRGRGIRPDQMVGLMVNDNCIEMIIGMISILKAGGAFLPIDPDFPKDRIEYMIEDSNIVVLLTQGKLRDEIRFAVRLSILTINRHLAETLQFRKNKSTQ
jgi:non-ribosomal peptide synthetase component F